jgi:thioredoxin 1
MPESAPRGVLNVSFAYGCGTASKWDAESDDRGSTPERAQVGNPYAPPGGRLRRIMTVRLLDFHADWCGPCKTQDPILEEIQEDLGDAFELQKVNVDEEQDVANQYQVRSLPTLIIENDEGVVDRFVGVTQREDIEAALSEAGA